MRYVALAEAIERRMETMAFGERFRFLASWYGGLPYAGGQENFVYGSDCSGTVCGPLWLLGYDIRCTADDLFRHIFTRPLTRYESREDVMAVFFATKTEREHFGRMVPAGHVTHVAPVIGRYVVQNAFDPVEPMASSYVYEWYLARGFDMTWRALDIDALKAHSRARDLVSGIDPILQQIRPQGE